MSSSSLYLETRRLHCRSLGLLAPSIKTLVWTSQRYVRPPQLTSSATDVIPFQNPSAHPAYLSLVTAPLPTVSCFVPSILTGSPFRVSLHSWSTPTISRETVARAPQEDMVGFEAKVLIDGICLACVTMLLISLTIVSWLTINSRGSFLSADPPWPQMIGEQIKDISAVYYTDSGGYRYVLSYKCIHSIQKGLR